MDKVPQSRQHGTLIFFGPNSSNIEDERLNIVMISGMQSIEHSHPRKNAIKKGYVKDKRDWNE